MVVALVFAVIMMGLVCMTALLIMYRMMQMKQNGGYLPEIIEKPDKWKEFSENISKKDETSEDDTGIINTKQDQKAMAEAQDAYANLMTNF